MHLPGYTEMFIRFWSWGELTVPAHQRMFVRVAPPDIPHAILSFASRGEPDMVLPASEVSDITASSNGWTFFGFGAEGMLGAGIAAAVDSWLAPWSIEFAGPNGHIGLYAEHGPPPSADSWGRVQQRLAQDAYAQRAVVQHEAEAETTLDVDERTVSMVAEILNRNGAWEGMGLPEWRFQGGVSELCFDLVNLDCLGPEEIASHGLETEFLLMMLELWTRSGGGGKRFADTLALFYFAEASEAVNPEDVTERVSDNSFSCYSIIQACLDSGRYEPHVTDQRALKKLLRAHQVMESRLGL